MKYIAFVEYRRLMREEGLLCGGSSGTAMVAALEACKKLKKGQRCVVILPDSIRNYMTKHLSDDWMIENNFMDENESDDKVSEESWWASSFVKDLDFSPPVTVSESVKVESAIQIMRNTGYDQLPVLKDEQVRMDTTTVCCFGGCRVFVAIAYCHVCLCLSCVCVYR